MTFLPFLPLSSARFFKALSCLWLVITLLSLSACDNPAAQANNHPPQIFELTLTPAGRQLVNTMLNQKNAEQKSTEIHISAAQGSQAHQLIKAFLADNNQRFPIFNPPEIPYDHVVLAHIRFMDAQQQRQVITIGEYWLAYYVAVDALGESSNTLYQASSESIHGLLRQAIKTHNKRN